MKLSVVAFAATVGAASATAVTPVAKVTKLLEDLIKQTEDEGAAEKKVYDEYACFCKDNTDSKSTAIKDNQAKIDADSAALEEARNDKAAAIADYAAATKELEELAAEKAQKIEEFNKEKARLDAVILDLEHANRSLDKAIDAMKASSDASASAAALVSVRKTVQHGLLVAEALGLPAAAKNANHALAMLQNPKDAAYGFQSGGIQDILDELKTDFSDRLAGQRDELSKLTTAHTEFLQSNEAATTAATDAQTNAQADRLDAETRIGEKTEALQEESKDLEANNAYLVDLTKSCELKGRTWDQRDRVRTDELKALNTALTVIKGSVTENDKVNKRALLAQQKSHVRKARRVSLDSREDSFGAGGFSFAQVRKTNLLSGAREARVVRSLMQDARAMKSVVLLQSALKLKASPFDKVKGLIQKLIERLTKEATEEATQKGYCDTEMGKAKKQRDFRKADVDKLNVALTKAQADKEQNEIDVATLKSELETLNSELDAATTARADEKDVNEKTLGDARDGLDAVKMAMDVLVKFYKGEYGVGGANSESVSLIQESPILEDEEKLADGGDIGGAYQGNQAGGDNVIALLDVIKSDYERTIKMTTSQEQEAQADFVKFDRASKVSMSAKETEKKNKEGAIELLTAQIASDFDDLATNVKLMDEQVAILQDLNPLCVDTGMSFEERKKKRDQEIEALGKALCQLDPENVETADCPAV
jgi:hypothetical protein